MLIVPSVLPFSCSSSVLGKEYINEYSCVCAFQCFRARWRTMKREEETLDPESWEEMRITPHYLSEERVFPTLKASASWDPRE